MLAVELAAAVVVAEAHDDGGDDDPVGVAIGLTNKRADEFLCVRYSKQSNYRGDIPMHVQSTLGM